MFKKVCKAFSATTARVQTNTHTYMEYGTESGKYIIVSDLDRF